MTEARPSMPVTGWIASAFIALVVAACGNASGPEAAAVPEPAIVPVGLPADDTPGSIQAAPVVTTAGEDPGDYRESLAFWRAAGDAGAALEVAHFRDLREMTLGSHAVIMGRVIGEVQGPTVSDPEEPIDARYTFTGYEVEVLEVVAGSLPVGDRKTIVLTTIGHPESYSPQPVLLFLHWKGQGYEDGFGVDTPAAIKSWDRATYRPVSSQGVFVDTPDGVVNPISEVFPAAEEDDRGDPLVLDVNGMPLEELKALVRSFATG